MQPLEVPQNKGSREKYLFECNIYFNNEIRKSGRWFTATVHAWWVLALKDSTGETENLVHLNNFHGKRDRAARGVRRFVMGKNLKFGK